MSDGYKRLSIFFSQINFLGSFDAVEKMPNFKIAECCFVGRSNVGKSSLINGITKNKKLAKTSKTPGRTLAINFFEIYKKFNLVDLPGYGYAKVSKKTREDLLFLIESYILKRSNLIKIFVLIDCRIGIKNSDIDMMDTIASSNKFFSIVLTKIDKCSNKYINDQKKSINSLMKNYKKNFLQIFVSSSKNNKGIIDIQKDIFNLSQDYEI